jgi:hypothetical protein
MKANKLFWNILKKYKTPLVLLLDKNYEAIKRNYLVLYLRKVQNAIRYMSDISDCDNFAFAFKGIADLYGNGVGIVIGLHKGKWHCWNIALTERGLEQVEPQLSCLDYELEDYIPILIII